jgi:hypothetical protein
MKFIGSISQSAERSKIRLFVNIIDPVMRISQWMLLLVKQRPNAKQEVESQLRESQLVYHALVSSVTATFMRDLI